MTSPTRGYEEALRKFENRVREASPSTVRANRFKSPEKKGLLRVNSGSEVLHDNTTNMSSTVNYGKTENMLDMSGKADLLLFESSRVNPSFHADQVILNQFPEFLMLKKLKALVMNF